MSLKDLWESEEFFTSLMVGFVIVAIIILVTLYSTKKKAATQNYNFNSKEPSPEKGEYCTVCNTKNPVGKSYCISCGSKLSGKISGTTEVRPEQKSVVCPTCGSKNSASRAYCSSCGGKLPN